MINVKILRLKTAEDIIGIIETKDTNKKSFKVKSPMLIDMVFDPDEEIPQLMMHYWLPVALVKNNEATISFADVLTVLDVNLDFRDYYLDIISGESFIDTSSKDDTILEQLQRLDTAKLH